MPDLSRRDGRVHPAFDRDGWMLILNSQRLGADRLASILRAGRERLSTGSHSIVPPHPEDFDIAPSPWARLNLNFRKPKIVIASEAKPITFRRTTERWMASSRCPRKTAKEQLRDLAARFSRVSCFWRSFVFGFSFFLGCWLWIGGFSFFSRDFGGRVCIESALQSEGQANAATDAPESRACR